MIDVDPVIEQSFAKLYPLPAVQPDWEQVLAAARLGEKPAAAPRREGRRRQLTRRQLLAAALVAGLVATLIATPAFGLRNLLFDLFDRIDVPFSGQAAPLEVKRQFFDLSLGRPASMAPDAVVAQTRRVAAIKVDGTTHVLWVAPTRSGGFCWRFSGGLEGCLTSPNQRPGLHHQPGSFHPGLLGVSTGFFRRSLTTLSGDILAPNAYSLAVRYANGAETPVRFYYVSKPIDAGFFFTTIPAGHQTNATGAVAIELRDRAGHLIARQPLIRAMRTLSPTQIAERLAEMRARLKRLRAAHALTPVPLHNLPPSAPPTAPLQQGQAEGVTVVAGHNGTVAFDTSHASAAVRALLAGQNAGYGCFRRVPYYSDPVDIVTSRTTQAVVAIRIQGMAPPFMGCDIQGDYGHSWPDRLHGHSAVEIAFMAAGRQYFADRAAARDLALFVRSRPMHTIRKLAGAALAQALEHRYGAAIRSLRSASAPLPPDRIAYAVTGSTTTFVEQSPTGRRFHVTIVKGHLRNENVKPLAFVF